MQTAGKMGQIRGLHLQSRAVSAALSCMHCPPAVRVPHIWAAVQGTAAAHQVGLVEDDAVGVRNLLHCLQQVRERWCIAARVAAVQQAAAGPGYQHAPKQQPPTDRLRVDVKSMLDGNCCPPPSPNGHHAGFQIAQLLRSLLTSFTTPSGFSSSRCSSTCLAST